MRSVKFIDGMANLDQEVPDLHNFFGHICLNINDNYEKI